MKTTIYLIPVISLALLSGACVAQDIDIDIDSGVDVSVNPGETYRAPSGAEYEYDLSDPRDRNDYSLGLDAQRRDQQSADPRSNTDRKGGYYGGGILDD